MRTNLTDDHKIITLWPAESISRGDRSRLPFRRIWQSTRPNFSPCSQPQHFRTLQRIFSRETRKGNVWLRRSMCEAAWAAAHSKNTYFAAQFGRIAARRGKKRALIAVAHSLLVVAYQSDMLSELTLASRRQPPERRDWNFQTVARAAG